MIKIVNKKDVLAVIFVAFVIVTFILIENVD